MKYIILFFQFVLFAAGVCGQNTFTLVYGGDESKRPNCIKQIDDFYYLASCDFVLPSFYGYKNEIVKIDVKGSIMHKIALFTEGQVSGALRKIYPLNETEFLVFGAYRSNEESNTSLWVIKMDTALNILWENKIQTDIPQLSRISYTVNNSGNIVLMLTLSALTPVYSKSIYFVELNLEGDLIKSRYETTGNPITTSGYSIIGHDNGYYAFVDGFSSYFPTPGLGFSERLDLDTNFNIINVLPLPEGMNGFMTANKIDEQSYFLAGEVYYSGFYTEIALQKTDTSNTVVSSNHAGLPGDIPDGAAWFECMTVANDNSIYTGGVGYDVSSFAECNLAFPKVFILSNYDSLLNCRWTKYYGSDTTCYYMMDLDATTDGGCIMAGTISSPGSNGDKTDVILIKVDDEGLITSSNNPAIRARQAVVYPNPGQDNLILQTGPQSIGAVFSLTGISGQVFIEQAVTSVSMQIDVSALPSGTYIWSLTKGDNLIETGKWIKQ